MEKIAKLSEIEREEIFRNTAQRMRVHPAIIEKDFWVCYILNYLFKKSKWSKAFVFKGGTSLSKVYNLIQRFSEDIDLILDWRLLGYGNSEPWNDRTNTKQDLFNKEANERAFEFLKDVLLKELNGDIRRDLKDNIEFYISLDDKQTINFVYPQNFFNKSILQEIRLEFGALASWTPTEKALISSFVAEEYPQIFKKTTIEVPTVTANRTFWEKITILHKEANRNSGKFPLRYSRHYYDLYCLAKSNIKKEILQDKEMLSDVVKFKSKFYRSKWARYEDAKIGTIKLIPDSKYMRELESDYVKMQSMLYGEVPEFSEIVIMIKELEKEINTLK